MHADLRAFLAALDAAGELAHVPVEVDPRFEVGAICRKALADNGPGLLFERVKGSEHRLTTNLLATHKRVALALGVGHEQLTGFWQERARHPLEPVLVTDAPCQEVIVQGDEVDLGRFAIPTWNENDGGPYVTFPCHISRNALTGGLDCGIYRAMVHGPRTLGLNAASARHLAMNRERFDGNKFPVAVALGLDPAIQIAAVAGLPYGESELSLAGALRGAPVEVVACKTIPLEVPAAAEIILEGYVTDQLRQEGPFGEFHGYYGAGHASPVMELTAITYRADAIYQGLYEGRPPNEDAIMQGLAMAGEIFRQVQLAGLKAINVTPHSAGHLHCVVSVTKPMDSYGKMVGLGVLGCWAARNVKLVTVVDDDVDVFNPGEVEWAVATRVDYARDVEIICGTTGCALDPALTDADRLVSASAKMIVDATRTNGTSFPKEAAPPPEVIEQVLANWSRYQIG